MRDTTQPVQVETTCTTEKQYIEFEVRSANSNLPPGSPVSQGDKVRVYREDVFKSISDGNGALGSTNAVF